MCRVVMPDYVVVWRCVSIFDSYKVRKCTMRRVLKNIRKADGDNTNVFKNRSLFSLKMEWICHNFLYNIDYQRWRTEDCDLDYPADHPEWLYCLCGFLVWLFVW